MALVLNIPYRNWRLILLSGLFFFSYYFGVYYVLSVETTALVKHYKSQNNVYFIEFLLAAINQSASAKTQSGLELSEQQLNNHHISLNLDKFPSSVNTFNLTSHQRLRDYLTHHKSQKLSYQLPNKLWLNYTNETHRPYLGGLFIFYLITLFFILMTVIYGWTILHYIVPLGRLRKSANQLKYDINAEVNSGPGPNGLKAAEEALQKMQHRLKELIDSRTKLLAAISHDLRTPLTRAKLKTYFLEDKDMSEKITNDLVEMENMLNATLNFAKNDFLQEKKKNLDITALLITVCDEFIDSGKNVSIHAKFPINYFGAKYALKRCFSNIIDNAIKYAKKVWVGIKIKEGRIIITFADDGSGIPEDQLNLVLKPFYRLPTKTNAKPGSGLGLTIVNEIIQQHGGQLFLTNHHRRGLLVTISLPYSAEKYPVQNAQGIW